MTRLESIEEEVVFTLDDLCPRDLHALPPAERAAVKLNLQNGFDHHLKVVLCVTYGNIARKFSSTARLVSVAESLEVNTVGDAVDLTQCAAAGKPWPGFP